jgi:DNA-binding protein HU-beta
MTQAELIKQVAEEGQTSVAAATRMVKFIGRKIVAELLINGRAVLPGIGILSTMIRAARVYINPKTGAPISAPARRGVRFRPSPELRKALKG